MEMEMENHRFQHVYVHSGSNWNLAVSVFEGKPEYPEKNPSEKEENQQQTSPTYDAGGPFLESPENFSGSRARKGICETVNRLF